MKFPNIHNRIKTAFWLLLALLLGFGIQPAMAGPAHMHIMEGFLPPYFSMLLIRGRAQPC